MASKKYAYYIEGNKIALVQVNETSDSLTTSEYGQYKSPTISVTDGLEIKYSYAPTYNIESAAQEGTGLHQFIGYGSDSDGDLMLFTYGASAVYDLSSLLAVDDWLYIDRGRWQGLHQVKNAGTDWGSVTLKTQFRPLPYGITLTAVDWTASTEVADGNAAANDRDIEAFKDLLSHRTTPYLFVKDADTAGNNGFYEVEYPSTAGQISFKNKITIDANGDYTTTAADITGTDTNDDVTFYNVFYEPMNIYEGVDVMEDESFELDLPRNLSNAVVYYLKAKLMEDMGEFDKKEYFMREYRKLVEKHNSAKAKTIFVAQGFSEIVR